MSQKTYLQVTGLMFTVGAIVHLLRVLLSWPATIGGWNVPTWISLVAIGVAGYLAYSSYKLMK